MSKMHQDDLIRMLEFAVEGAEEEGDQIVPLATWQARALLELARRAPKPRGHPPLRAREVVKEGAVRVQARIRKKELIAEGKPKEAAHEQAAEEAAAKLSSRNLSVETVKRLMEQRRRR